jgi:hypothetical protein
VGQKGGVQFMRRVLQGLLKLRGGVWCHMGMAPPSADAKGKGWRTAGRGAAMQMPHSSFVKACVNHTP